MLMRESSCWTRFERSNRPKGAGSFLDRFFISTAFSTGNSDVLGLDVQTYPTISSREALHKNSFIELGFFAEAVSILVFVTHSVLNYHVVVI